MRLLKERKEEILVQVAKQIVGWRKVKGQFLSVTPIMCDEGGQRWSRGSNAISLTSLFSSLIKSKGVKMSRSKQRNKLINVRTLKSAN